MGKKRAGYDRKFYRTAGITFEVRSDLPISEDTFDRKFKVFEVDGPGEDNVVIHHHFEAPELDERSLGKEIYRKIPWAIYQNREGYVYLWIPPLHAADGKRRVAFFNRDHTRGEIYNDRTRLEAYRAGGAGSLTLFPTDQILIGRILSARQGCILHSAGMIIEGKGYLFVGHSDAGKSTIVELLRGRGVILCDDRNVVCRREDGFRVYGSWSHGDVPDVSAASAPLGAVMFLNQSTENRIIPLDDELDIVKKLVSCMVKPFVTPDWWEKTLDLAEQMAEEAPCYDLYFDKSGEIEEVLEDASLWIDDC